MILLDTHVVIWLAHDEERISLEALRAVRREKREPDGLAISAVTLYEIAMLFAKRRIRLPVPLKTFLGNVESRFVVKPLTSAIASAATELPSGYPGDPMDRIIGATALVEGLKLITSDALIQNSKAVQIVW